jgi:transcriptional regulator with XRE-family HTH domain
VPAVDDLLGGLIPGDNVVWSSDDPALFAVAEAGFLRIARERKLRRIYVTAVRGPDEVTQELGGDVIVLDARPRGEHGNADVLEQGLIASAHESSPLCVIIEGLDSLAHRWGDAKTAAFFSRVCPRLFDLDAIAYWRAPRPAVSRRLLDRITGVTQCMVELSKGRLRVIKAEGRPAASHSRLLRASIVSEELLVEAERALGRLARSLERLRRERQLTQTDLARLAGVSPSAISQAEAGRRGLSVDTLLLLGERLGITIDDLLTVTPPAGYVLARRERRGPGASITPLLDDPKAGMRAFLVRLRGGESGQPPHSHKGTELVMGSSGLVQLVVGTDTPVLRSGDAVLATTVPISSWRNLTAEPATLFWIVRD